MSKKRNTAGAVTRLTELQQVKILLVKATEQKGQPVLSSLTVSGANIAAIGAKTDPGFIEKRASYLFEHLPTSLKHITSITHFPGNWQKATLIISLVIGLLSNYLGPSKLIHVVYNPLTILLVWNFFVYVLLIVRSFMNIGVQTFEKPVRILTDSVSLKKDKANTEDETRKKPSGFRVNFIVDRLIGGIFKKIITFKTRLADDTAKVSQVKPVWTAFWSSYREIAGKSLIYRFRNLVNVSAVGLLLGALAGVYLRGLFFNYQMIWQSTFVSDPSTVRLFLNILLGPASLLIDGSLISRETVQLLLQPQGTSAAPWIHKLALSAGLFILIPRVLMAAAYARIATKRIKPIDLSDDYYQAILNKTRSNLVNIIREGIRNIIVKQINTTALSITNFVIRDYYEKIIVPQIMAYREKGGKITKLENKLLESQREFEPILSGYMKNVKGEFKESVLNEINLFLGRKFDIDISTTSSYQARSDNIDQKLSSQVAGDIGDTLGGTIVTGVAVAVGTISGGLGKSLGIAIISGLLGVSGPIGLLIGSLITVAALGGFYTFRRDQISGLIKNVYLPPMITKMALSDAKISKARQDTFTHTQNEIKKILNPTIEDVTNELLKDIV